MQQKAKMRDTLVTITRELLVEKGFRATSIQEIAERAGISKGAFYSYFDAKEDLLQAILAWLNDQLEQGIMAIREDPSLDPRQKLRSQIIHQFGQMVEHRGLNESLINGTDYQVNEELVLFIKRCRFNWQKIQESFILDAYGAKISRFVIDAAVILNGMLNEYLSFMLYEGLEPDPEHLGDLLIDLMDHVVACFENFSGEPVLREEMMPTRLELEQQQEAYTIKRAMELLEDLREQGKALKLNPRQQQELTAVFALMEDALKQSPPNKVLLQGMLANLKDNKNMEETRAKLARQMDVRLL